MSKYTRISSPIQPGGYKIKEQEAELSAYAEMEKEKESSPSVPIVGEKESSPSVPIVGTGKGGGASGAVDDILKDIANAAPSTKSGTETGENSESDKYAALRKEYLDKYLSRGEFDYDTEADELYEKYKNETLASAEKSRRHASAVAAGLTGGYGSTYAIAAGNAAYGDALDGLDDALLAFEENARAKYDREGEDLLSRADLAKAFSEELADAERLESIYGQLFASDEASLQSEEEYNATVKAKNEKYNFANSGKYEELEDYKKSPVTPLGLAELMYERGYTTEQIEAELLKLTKKDGTTLDYSAFNYIMNKLEALDTAKYVSTLKDKNGVGLADFYAELLERNKRGDISDEELISALTSWTAADGSKLEAAHISALFG